MARFFCITGMGQDIKSSVPSLSEIKESMAILLNHLNARCARYA